MLDPPFHIECQEASFLKAAAQRNRDDLERQRGRCGNDVVTTWKQKGSCQHSSYPKGRREKKVLRPPCLRALLCWLCLFWHPQKGVVSRCGQMENENLDLVQFYDTKALPQTSKLQICSIKNKTETCTWKIVMKVQGFGLQLS